MNRALGRGFFCTFAPDMGIAEILLLAVGVSMDAFAVSIAKGISAGRARVGQALTAGLWFGGFQALMPLLGFFFGRSFAAVIGAWDHWVAFALLTFIGGNMVREALFGGEEHVSADFSFKSMLSLAIATSIDALAVGVSFACLKISVWMPVAIIGLVTMAFSVAGVYLGNVFGLRFRSKAGLAGGVVLMLIGLNILWEHTMQS